MAEPVTKDFQGGQGSWRRLRPYVLARPGQTLALAGSATVSGFAEAGVLVLIVQIALAVSRKDTISLSLGPLQYDLTIGSVLVLALVLAFIRLVMGMVAAYLGPKMARDSLIENRNLLFAAYADADWSTKSKEREGHLQELLTTQVKQAARVILLISMSITAAFNLFALIVSAFVVNIVAAAAVLGALGLLFLILRPLNRLGRNAATQQSTDSLDYSSGISEAVRLALEAQVFDVYGPLRDRVNERADTESKSFFRVMYLQRAVPALYQGIALILIILALAGLYGLGPKQLASIGGVILILVRSLSYGQTVQTTFHQVVGRLPYAERVAATQESYAAAEVPEGGRALDRFDGLGFDHVSFDYGTGTPVLRDLSFAVTRGETIGIIGPSGAGKSSLVALLLRLYEPTAGQMTVNGGPVGDIDRDAWHRLVAFAPQDSRLLSASVTDNIRFLRDGLDDSDIERAARAAQIHTEILEMPDGYDTVIGESDNRLSGGQRQRLCLARALATDPEILILDEPTSALDVPSEARLQQSLEELKGEVTMVVIAHRISTLNICDRVMVLERGEIKAFESAAALLESSDFYREAVELSTRHNGAPSSWSTERPLEAPAEQP